MFTWENAPSVEGDARVAGVCHAVEGARDGSYRASARTVWLGAMPPAEAEKIGLLFEILGWHVRRGGASDAGAGLVLRAHGNIIAAHCADAAVARQMALAGVDRLVMPVPLAALEQLVVVAG